MMNDDTRLQHPEQIILKEGNRPIVSPIHQSVKFTVETYDQLFRSDFYFYSRMENPTVRELEKTLAALQGCEDAIAVASGCAAIAMPLLSLLKTGDHVLLFIESYKPTRYLVQDLLARFGVTSTLVSITDHAAINRSITPNTKVMIFESPTNPMVQVADLDFLLGLANAKGILTIFDGTFAGFFNHGDYPIDLTVHSLTKFAAGHGDVMGGIILGNKERIARIRYATAQIGPALDPHAAFLISRGLKTYNLRRRQQCETAHALALWLEKQPSVENVRYPGLKSHPRHALAKKQMRDFGSILAFDVKGRDLQTFFNALRLFAIAASLGATESLAAPVQLFYGKDLSVDAQRVAGITESSVRLSIGLEALEDLKQDLDHALLGKPVS